MQMLFYCIFVFIFVSHLELPLFEEKGRVKFSLINIESSLVRKSYYSHFAAREDGD